MNALSEALAYLISKCYTISGSYLVAIALFTILTKIVLFPVSLWTHRNGIKMVELMPSLNQLKINHYGDKDAIAEATQVLYKERGYHPLASLVPLVIQMSLLMGVIGAVRKLLSETNSVLVLIPSESGGWTIIMPVLAGFAAFILGLAQNHLNPLQREQPKAEQWGTNIFSISISLILGAFVPVGVGCYWICSNLSTILLQLALNSVMPAEKYVDYVALTTAKEELNEIENLSNNISQEDKRREKEDYRRFFSVVNKHLVFYSEASGFYKYFQAVIEYLLENSNIVIHYISSDPKDGIFDISKKQPRIRAYYIGEKRLITLFMKMDADMVIMTVPDLENMYLKRSYVRKDIEYVYTPHGIVVGMRTFRPNAIDHFDTIFVQGKYIEQEIRRAEEVNHTPRKHLVRVGYSVIDNMMDAYSKMEIQSLRARPMILIAPSWQEDNIVESCLNQLCDSFLESGFDLIVRPHPQYLRRYPKKFQAIMQSFKEYPSDRITFELDFSSNETIYSADLVVTDWSGIGYEYALSTKKPVLFINTPMKVVNPQFADWGEFEMKMRNSIGISLNINELRDMAGEKAKVLINNQEKYKEIIDNVLKEELYHVGESGKFAAQYILTQISKKQKRR